MPTTREKLRHRQGPLKEAYRADPAAARITLKATGELDSNDIVCSIETGRALVSAGLHPGTGGDEFYACSGDMLLQALAACSGVTLRAVATSMEIDVTGIVRVEGDLDFRGTLGIDQGAPVGFLAIRLMFDLQSNASQDQLDTLMQRTEKYCVVYQSLVNGVPVDVSSTLNA